MVLNEHVDMGEIKGAALREFLDWYVVTRGREALEQRINRLRMETQSALDISGSNVGVLASNWYPAHVIHSLLDAIFEGASSEEREQMIQDGAAAVMRSTLQGVYKFVFRTMMSPERYGRYSQKLWDRYYSCGLMTKESMGPGKQVTTISDWKSHHQVICDLNAAGSRYIYEAMGCRDVGVQRIGCVSTGHDACSFAINWSTF